MTTLLDAFDRIWNTYGYPQTLYSDGEGAFNNPTAKAQLASKGTDLRIRARGQHATTVEARNGLLRHTMHHIEQELKERDIPLQFTRLLSEAVFACNAFTFYNECSPYNALLGRQPACLPDLPTPDFEQKTDTSGHEREAQIRAVSIEAITQATAVAKTLRALKDKTHIPGERTT